MTGGSWLSTFVAVACGFAVTAPSAAQTALSGQNLSAVAPENLAKTRPAPPFDLTGTWNMVIDPKNGDARVHAVAEVDAVRLKRNSRNTRTTRVASLEYRDDPGACWPLGMPRMMTRFLASPGHSASDH